MGTNHVIVKVCASAKDAPEYATNGEGFQFAELAGVIIIRNGTAAGNDTVDLQFKDKDGNKFVAMVSGAIIKTIGNSCNLLAGDPINATKH